jgi:hypothetical protein
MTYKIKEVKQPTYLTKWDRRKIRVLFAVHGRNRYEMCTWWLSPDCADKDAGTPKKGKFPGRRGVKKFIWLEFRPCWGTMTIVSEDLGQDYSSCGSVTFKAPGGTLFKMSGKAFRSHGCMDYVERRNLTGHWEIQGRSGSLHVLEGIRFWTGERTRTCYGSNYTFDLRWYPEDPMSPENKTKTQAVLDAMPEPISWRDYYRIGNNADTCKNGDWPERPRGIHGHSPKDIEPCYYIENYGFFDTTLDMKLVVSSERANYATNPTLLLPFRVKPSAISRRKKEEKEKRARKKD